jgi:hypothetical protein
VENLFADSVVETYYKGSPLDSYGKKLTQFLASKPNLFTADFQFPIMVLKKSALENNISSMASVLTELKTVWWFPALTLEIPKFCSHKSLNTRQ